MRSTGPASAPKLNDALFAVLEKELGKGPVAHGWPDQTWTLPRIKDLIGRRFHKSFSLSDVSQRLASPPLESPRPRPARDRA